jgi:hypothetical protein
MRSSSARMAATILVFALVGCAPAASLTPRSEPTTTPQPSSAPGPSAVPSSGSTATSMPPSSTPTQQTTTSVLVHGSARELSSHDILMAPGHDGSLYVVIPSRSGSTILAQLDSTGSLRSGWPVVLDGADFCAQLLPADDGSVRVICTKPNPAGDMYPLPVIYGFGEDGHRLGGWPLELTASSIAGRMIGEALTLLEIRPLGDGSADEQPSVEAVVTSVDRDGATTDGTAVPFGRICCTAAWALGPDGVAYVVRWPDEGVGSTRVDALARAGSLAGWPVSIGGTGTTPGFGPGGRIVMVVGAATGTTRVVTVDRDGAKHPSGRLPIRTFEVSYDTGGCAVGLPRPPLTAGDGTTFLYSELDRSIYALDTSLEVKRGWPFEPASALQVARPGLESEHEAGYCPTPVVPAVGSDGALYLAVEPRSSKVGGSLVAVGSTGRVRSGWPVELRRPGSEFWSVVAGPGGTAYALAVEPESGGKSSASILAIAPDSTVRWTTTIIDP